MVFSSAVFIFLFLPITFVINLLLPKKCSNIVLLLASLLFYAWGEPILVCLMIMSIIINWIIGLVIYQTDGTKKKVALAIGIACNLCALGYYKYAAFLIGILNGLFRNNTLPLPNIELPIGISFFTFQAISYVVDVYRGEAEVSSKPINVALYISFFPQLIAGPIVKYRDINRQIENRTITLIGVSEGFKRFIYGLAKKVLISNVLGLCVDTIYSYNINRIDSVTAWIGALAYTFQIYYDFSGYSDMAIGIGKMFGFNILENFNYPYISESISKFWRRWHISLGTWFREYLYFPLGGNRRGNVRTYINLGIVFFLTGLWHGADVSFVLWGIYHGAFQVIERMGLQKILDKHKIVAKIYCFLVVNFGWVLFRADNTMYGIRYISRMIMPWRHSEINIPIWNYADYKTLFCGLCAVIGMGILKYIIPEKVYTRWRNSIPEALFAVFLLILSIASIASDTYNPFIYFQF